VSSIGRSLVETWGAFLRARAGNERGVKRQAGRGAMDEDNSAVMEDTSFNTFAPPSAHWLATACADVHLLPFWDDNGEQEEHIKAILEFRVKPCPEFQKGFCAKHGGKGKASQCFDYHFESQCRRCPVDPNTGQLLYWDAACQAWSSEMGFCPNGDACLFAHGFEEISYHPAKYKTRPCNGRDCRGEGACCFAHGDAELRRWAPDCYAYLAIVGPCLGISAASASGVASGAIGRRPGLGGQPTGVPGGAPQLLKHRFCASYPNISQCRRGHGCAFAHSRDEVKTPLLAKEEEDHDPAFLTEPFFTGKFKTLWCPIGAQHDWQSCVYAHTYQDARRKPSIGYGPQPCPYWSKKDTRAAYSQRCPLGLRCPYSHGAKEQLYHPKYFRTVICRDLQQRGCPRSHLCAFHHKRSERRAVGNDTVDYSKPLKKTAIPPDWASSFLSPPFFQETCEAESQVPISFPAGPPPGAWAFTVPIVADSMTGKPIEAGWEHPAAASTSAADTAAPAAPNNNTGEAAGASSFPEESPRTQSTAADEGDGSHARGGGEYTGQVWPEASGEVMPYFTPCFGGDGGDGSGFTGFPVFAGTMMPVQPFWWTAAVPEEAEAAA